MHQIEALLYHHKRLPLRQLAAELWEAETFEAVRATIAILRMGAAVRSRVGDYPLLPHRIHLLVRPTDGLVVCLNPGCSGDPQRKMDGLGCISTGYHEQCTHCGGATLSLHRCANCGEWGLAAVVDELRVRPVLPSRSDEKVKYLSFRPIEKAGTITLDVSTGEERARGLTLALFTNCPRCETAAREDYLPFASGIPLTLAILAETALAELPEYPASHKEERKNNLSKFALRIS